MKSELRPIVAGLVEAGAVLRRGLPVFGLPHGFEMVVLPETSKFGLPKGIYLADAHLCVRWPRLEAILGALGPYPDTGVTFGVARFAGGVVGVDRKFSWEVPDEANERDLVSAILVEGRQWCVERAEFSRQLHELERNVRSNYGQPVRWPIAAYLVDGPDRAREVAGEVLTLLGARRSTDTIEQEMGQVRALLTHLNSGADVETALGISPTTN